MRLIILVLLLTAHLLAVGVNVGPVRVDLGAPDDYFSDTPQTGFFGKRADKSADPMWLLLLVVLTFATVVLCVYNYILGAVAKHGLFLSLVAAVCFLAWWQLGWVLFDK